MAMYWPDKRVAFDIIDDPSAEHVDPDEGWTVVTTTMEELSTFETCEQAFLRVAYALGVDTPEYLAELDLYEDRRRQLYNDLHDPNFLR